jgi:uncharacterized glyoxalase superfamily protein PhnB
MNPHIGVVALGVSDVSRSKQFYGDLGWPIKVDQGQFVLFDAAAGSSGLALYKTEALARDAGVSADGTGFHGLTFSYIVRSNDRVDALLADAERAGGSIIRPAEQAKWGGYFGYFADPDGYLWKVVTGDGEQPYGE